MRRFLCACDNYSFVILVCKVCESVLIVKDGDKSRVAVGTVAESDKRIRCPVCYPMSKSFLKKIY